VERGFGVELLTGEAEVEGEIRCDGWRGAFVGSGVAEGRGVPFPHGLVAGVDDDAWGIEVIGVDEEHGG
jgi:hypothetical protein